MKDDSKSKSEEIMDEINHHNNSDYNHINDDTNGNN